MGKLTDILITKRPLNRKVIVITGASSGVGRAAALEFAQHGATLILAARRENALVELVEECESLGAKAVAVPTDVSDAEAVQALAHAAIDSGGRIDVWINNAGVLAAGPFSETPVEINDRVIDINLKGYLHGAYAVLPFFKKQNHGVIINNISVGGWIPTPYAAGYTASKYGLKGFGQALRAELRDWPDIHVCDMFPAFLDTPGIQHAANYTEVELKPAPPVFDPKTVARAMVKLSQRPKAITITDAYAPFLKLSYGIFPGLFTAITAKVISTYLEKGNPIKSTTGNVFDPVGFGTSVYGGWRNSRIKPFTKVGAALLLAGVALVLSRNVFKK